MPEVAEDTWRAANEYVDRKQAEHIEAEFVEHAQPGAALAVREEHAPALALPVVSPLEAKAAMQKYFEVCEAVLSDEDYQEFEQWDPKQRKKVKKRFKKKSAVKKLQTFWNIQVKVSDVHRDDLGDGHFGFRCVATASTPSGREVQATGACSTHEERFEFDKKEKESQSEYEYRCRKARARSYHDVLSTAETRATNRAVMNCIGVGGGEVTADEISRDRRDERRDPPQPALPKVAELLHRAQGLGICTDGATFAEWLRDRIPGCEGAGKGWTPNDVQKRAIIAEMDSIEKSYVVSIDPGVPGGDHTAAFIGRINPSTGNIETVFAGTMPAPPAESQSFDRRNEERRIFAICADPKKNAIGKKINDDLRHQLMEKRYAKSSMTQLTDGQVIDFSGWLEGRVK